jgi:hypothetical protein
VEGAFLAMVMGSMIFGCAAVWTAFRAIAKIEQRARA